MSLESLRMPRWLGLAFCVGVAMASTAHAQSLVLNAGAITIDTDALTITGSASANGFLAGGVATFQLDQIHLGSGVTVTLQGSNALSLKSLGNLYIDATLNASGTGQTGRIGGFSGGNAGFPPSPGDGPGGGGVTTSAGGCCWGGGGGGYGGAGGTDTFSGLVGAGGTTYGDSEVTVLFGGSGAGGGGNCCGETTPFGGAGGGAIDLFALGSVTIDSSAQLLVDGADGSSGVQNRSGGGGSGGSLRITGTQGVDIAAGALLSAMGGQSLPLNSNRTGGGGGGGRIALYANGLTNAGTQDVSGGIAINTADAGNESGLAGTTFSGSAQTGYASRILFDSPVAYWRLNETSGTTATDIAGGHDGTYVGNPMLGQAGPQPPNFNGFATTNAAPEFDGAGDGVQATGANAVQFGGDYSVSLFFKTDGASIETSGNDLFSATNGGHGVLLEVQEVGGDNRLRFLHRSPTGSSGGQNIFHILPADGDPFYDEFHQLVAVKEGTTMELYLDGELIDSAAASGDFNIPMDIAIARISPNVSSRDFIGLIDEVAIFDYALSAEQVDAQFQAASVPEPASIALWILMGLSVAGFAWRRKRAA